MTHCRYCNRFRLIRVSGSGPWLLDCGHIYLPLHSEGQRRTVHSGVDVGRAARVELVEPTTQDQRVQEPPLVTAGVAIGLECVHVKGQVNRRVGDRPQVADPRWMEKE